MALPIRKHEEGFSWNSTKVRGARRGLKFYSGLLQALLVPMFMVSCSGGGGGGSDNLAATYQVSGNAGSAGVSLSYTDGTVKTVTSDASGNYTFTVPVHWSGSVTPTIAKSRFSPATRTYSNVASDATAQDFTVSRAFWVDSLTTPSSWQNPFFKLAYQTERCNVWVLPRDEDSISLELLEHFGDYYTAHSWPDVTTYVHEPTEFFGEPGSRVNMLFFKMAESYAGYFWDNDFFAGNTGSNGNNVFYLNIDAAVDPTDQAYATLFTEGTLTHEFQHMCNAHYFYFDPVGSTKARQMDSWANEFCSVTMESVFAGQMDVYIPQYKTRPSFKSGNSDFLQWRNDFTQYTATSMLGTYLLSQVPEANRANLYKTFLANTWSEGSSGATYTSVEDLLATLQDVRIGWTPVGWTPITDFATQQNRIRDDWSSLLKGFCTGLTGANAGYNAYVSARSQQTISPACIPIGAAAYSLKPSGWFIGRTAVNDLASDSILSASATGTIPAFTFVYNATIPSDADLNSETAVLPEAITTVAGGQLVARISESVESGRSTTGRSFTRASGPLRASRLLKAALAPVGRPAIAGNGNTVNGGSVTAGYNYCGYVPR